MSKLKLAIVAALLASSSNVWADAKYKRTQDVKVDVKLSDRVKPIQTKPQGKSEFKPELTADAVLSIEGLVSNIRNEQEAILAKLIDSTPDSEVEALAPILRNDPLQRLDLRVSHHRLRSSQRRYQMPAHTPSRNASSTITSRSPLCVAWRGTLPSRRADSARPLRLPAS